VSIHMDSSIYSSLRRSSGTKTGPKTMVFQKQQLRHQGNLLSRGNDFVLIATGVSLLSVDMVDKLFKDEFT
jgi:hypothetical protein